MARKKKSRLPKQSAHQDAQLISACVELVQNRAAYDAGMQVDPDGNFIFAGAGPGEGGRDFVKRAEKAMHDITRMKATTPDGLFAKARSLETIIKIDHGAADSRALMACCDFANEVAAWLEKDGRTAAHTES